MEYLYTTDSQPIVDYTTEQLLIHLDKGEKVVWLLSGGSAIDTQILIAQHLEGRDLTHLSVSLTDERFGPVGHPDENWKQLLDRGLVLTGADLYRPLIGQDSDTTNRAFGVWLESYLTDADYVLGMFGMGEDGHTAGIKPGSIAVSAEGWSIEYPWDDFDRMTMTFSAIKAIDQAVIRIMGEDKFPTVHSLLTEDIPLEKQPVQIFKHVKQGILFTDYKEEVL
jgi:6-phosphogluconolactonase/glucosamine-6-phosphate isomerase/deaminase